MGFFEDILNAIGNALIGFFWPYISWFINLIVKVAMFIQTFYDLGASIVGLFTGLFWDIYSVNPYAASFMLLVLASINYVIWGTVWNIIADLQIFGVKLPKVPL